MLTAQNKELQYILKGTEVSSDSQALLKPGVVCPICGKTVKYTPTAEHPFEFFLHEDGSANCFESDRDSIKHSRAVEAVLAVIYNRLVEITQKPIEIDIERQIGSSTKFVIADVRVADPIQVAAEIFYRTDDLELRRRLAALSKNDYRTWLIFHDDGAHNIRRIQRYFQEVTPLSVGRYNAETLEVTLGDLFSKDKIDYSKASNIPNYIIYTPDGTTDSE